MTAAIDVIEGRRRWSVGHIQCENWLPYLPDDSIDLMLFSPPYEGARTYGLSGKLPTGQAWVDWMHSIVDLAAPKVKGLIAIVCEGQTKSFRYSATPMLLAADLHRAGYKLRKPACYYRKGIFGGGGPDWLVNHWEFVLCIARGRLPWSDNTACGHPPKYPPGGAPSHRTAGTRGSKGGDTRVQRKYKPPKLANPGNVIRCKVGGGQMGHPTAHDNEAPFPLKLAEFFVKSFCPPDGIVCDPMSGSGTTAHAAVIHGRRFIGCEIRSSQVELTKQRIKDVMPA